MFVRVNLGVLIDRECWLIQERIIDWSKKEKTFEGKYYQTLRLRARNDSKSKSASSSPHGFNNSSATYNDTHMHFKSKD